MQKFLPVQSRSVQRILCVKVPMCESLCLEKLLCGMVSLSKNFCVKASAYKNFFVYKLLYVMALMCKSFRVQKSFHTCVQKLLGETVSLYQTFLRVKVSARRIFHVHSVKASVCAKVWLCKSFVCVCKGACLWKLLCAAVSLHKNICFKSPSGCHKKWLLM